MMNTSTQQLYLDLAPLLAKANDCGHAFSSTGQTELCLLNSLLPQPSITDDQAITELKWELHSGTVITLLDQLMAMEGLLPDPHLRGGGLVPLGAKATRILLPAAQPDFRLEHRLSCLLMLGEPGGRFALSLTDAAVDEYSCSMGSGDAVLLRSAAGKEVAVTTVEPAANNRLLVIHYYAQPLA